MFSVQQRGGSAKPADNGVASGHVSGVATGQFAMQLRLCRQPGTHVAVPARSSAALDPTRPHAAG